MPPSRPTRDLSRTPPLQDHGGRWRDGSKPLLGGRDTLHTHSCESSKKGTIRPSEVRRECHPDSAGAHHGRHANSGGRARAVAITGSRHAAYVGRRNFSAAARGETQELASSLYTVPVSHEDLVPSFHFPAEFHGRLSGRSCAESTSVKAPIKSRMVHPTRNLTPVNLTEPPSSE